MFENIQNLVAEKGLGVATNIGGAILLWVVGRWVIRRVISVLQFGMNKQKVDPTIARWAGSIVGILLNVVLMISILSRFGVETTSFAALLAGAGLAIAGAWSGLLGNFAAGAFLLIFRPFKVGDSVTVGGVTGTVEEIAIFGTTILDGTNVRITVGNNKIFSGDIVNYSQSKSRRVDRTAVVAGSVDPKDAISRFTAAVEKLPNVLADPKPSVFVLDFVPAGVVIAIRPFALPQHHDQVFADINEAIIRVNAEAKWPAALPASIVRQG